MKPVTKKLIHDLRFMIHEKGFTLLEIVITTAILVIVGVTGILSYHSFNRTIDLSAVAEDVASHLRRAQTRAMNADDLKRWGIHFDNPGSGDDYYSLFSGDSYAADVEKYFLPARVVFTTPAASATVDVLFEKLSGSSVNGAQTVVLQTTDGSQTKTISINTVGKISF